MPFNEQYEWVKSYIGIPYVQKGRELSGADCWGLVYLVWKNQFNILVPTYDDVSYENPGDSVRIGQKVEEETSKCWKGIEVGDASAGDALVMSMRGHPMHIGIIIQPGTMLHTLENIGSHLSDYQSFVWKKRIRRAYRYAP